MFRNVYDGSRCLITGHTGFKGSWLALWLTCLGAEVTGFALPPEGDPNLFEVIGIRDGIRHVEGDIREIDSLSAALAQARPRFVFHLAAQALVREGYRDPKTTFDVNVGGAVNLLEAVRRTDSVRALVFVTSDKCYRNEEWVWGYRENDPLGGDDPYSASKGCAELVFHSYLKSFLLPEGRVKAASARAGNVIGGGDWAKDRIFPDCMRALAEGRPIVIRNPDATRPWQHVLDALAAYLHLGERLYNSADLTLCTSWNFGPDKDPEKTVKDLVAETVELWGSGEFTVRRDPDAPKEAAALCLNSDKAHRILGWRPVWDFYHAAKHAVEWYKAFSRGSDMRKVGESQILAFTERWKEMGLE